MAIDYAGMTMEERIENGQGLAIDALGRMVPGAKTDEDWRQLAMVGLWKAAKDYDPEKGSFSTLVYCYVKTEVGHEMNYRQRDKRKIAYTNTGTIHESEKGSELDRMDIIGKDMEWLDWSGFMDKLNPMQRRLVRLRIEGYNYREIGEMMGCSYQWINCLVKKIRPIFDRYI